MKIEIICYSLFSAVVGAFIVIFLNNMLSNPPLKIVSVNVNTIVDQFVQNTAKSSLDKLEIEQNTQLFAKQLEKEMHQLAKEERLVLLINEAIIAGVPDYTALVLSRLKLQQDQASDRKHSKYFPQEVRSEFGHQAV